MNEYAGIKTYTAEHHEAEAKRLRKAEKAARKAEKAARQRARAVAEHRAEQARLHKLALDALAEIVADGRKPTAHRVAAARELLAVTA